MYDTFFGDTKKMNKKNMQIMDQQIASNNYAMERKKEFDNIMSNVKVPSGLGTVKS